MVLGIAVDLSTLPYLLCLFPGSPPSGRPQSVGPSWLRLRQSEKSCKQRFGASPVGDAGQSWKRRWPGLPVRAAGQSRKRAPFLLGQAFRSERRAGVRSERCPFLGQAFRSERRTGVGSECRSSLAKLSSQRLDRPSGLSLGFWAGPGVARRSQRRLLGRAFAGKQVHEEPRVYEPDSEPER